ncbi:hypothetical protein [Blastopirellula marina]|uniref:Uncharacterized protein n=1 Tax=Blastopirellula marina TaxID=124 RepID=A0A2S8GIS9_9BACT|nr:hypothetical protein [Blastopirellula marina]PQO44355.1 hypothetical protein C5Y93_20565 [Blastopirellula marina]
MAGQDVRLRAISSAFYGLASNQQLEFALTADLLPIDINFDNYFEAYLIGVDYAVTADEVVVIDYRAKYGVAI